jgi:hypothetical protein
LKEAPLLDQREAASAAQASQQHSDIIRGAGAMAQALNLSRRSVEHLLQTRRLQSPRKLGGRWFVSRSRLLKFVGD